MYFTDDHDALTSHPAGTDQAEAVTAADLRRLAACLPRQEYTLFQGLTPGERALVLTALSRRGQQWLHVHYGCKCECHVILSDGGLPPGPLRKRLKRRKQYLPGGLHQSMLVLTAREARGVLVDVDIEPRPTFRLSPRWYDLAKGA